MAPRDLFAVMLDNMKPQKATPQQLWVEIDQIIQSGGVISGSPKVIVWERRHRLQQLLEAVIEGDLDYAFRKDADSLLWNYCFKACIDHLRRDQGRKDELYMLLSATSGSLNNLLATVAVKYNVDIAGYPIPRYLGTSGLNAGDKKPQSCSPDKAQSFVEFCLIHLGDAMRYQNQTVAAESFYRYAAQAMPNRGHAFNQLAIVEASRRDKISAVYFYTRSLHVDLPFQPASGNLDSLLVLKETDSPPKGFADCFMRILSHAHCFHKHDDLQLFRDVLREGLEKGELSAEALFRAAVTTIAALWRITKSFPTRGSDEFFALQMSSADELQAHELLRGTIRSSVEELIRHLNRISEEKRPGWMIPLNLFLGLFSGLSATAEAAIVNDGKGSLELIRNAVELLGHCWALWNNVVTGPELARLNAACRGMDNVEKRMHIDERVLEAITSVPLQENQELRCFVPLMNTFNAGIKFHPDSIVYAGTSQGAETVHRLFVVCNGLASLIRSRIGWKHSSEETYTIVQLCSWQFVESKIEESDKCPGVSPSVVEKIKSSPTDSASASPTGRRTKVSERLSEMMKKNQASDVKSPPGLLKVIGGTEEEKSGPEKRKSEPKPPRFQPPRFQAAKLKQALTGTLSKEEGESSFTQSPADPFRTGYAGFGDWRNPGPPRPLLPPMNFTRPSGYAPFLPPSFFAGRGVPPPPPPGYPTPSFRPPPDSAPPQFARQNDNSVFFSIPRDPFYHLWQNDSSSPIGSAPASGESSQEVWGSGSLPKPSPSSPERKNYQFVGNNGTGEFGAGNYQQWSNDDGSEKK